jgi:hypothetical protein
MAEAPEGPGGPASVTVRARARVDGRLVTSVDTLVLQEVTA